MNTQFVWHKRWNYFVLLNHVSENVIPFHGNQFRISKIEKKALSKQTKLTLQWDDSV